MIPLDRRSFGCEGFPASPAAARAKLTARVDAHMAESAQTLARAYMQLAIYHQPGSETLDDKHKQQVLDLGFIDRAVPKLRESGCVCVVLHENGQAELCSDDVPERNIVPFQVWRDLDRAGSAVDQS